MSTEIQQLEEQIYELTKKLTELRKPSGGEGREVPAASGICCSLPG